MVIRDVDGQVEKALNEIQMRYSRGMEFTIYDLMATSACIDAQNFDSYKIMLEIRISNRGVAGCSGTKNGVRLFKIMK
ncbi:hypothetical protein [Fusobacterium sp.]|uniref:hypothetical protein n=1 Tax=Fusobacterium sp. TaxID=68766 RepID=UPI0025BF8DB4|nr:hypothetical protein [Fusobacterium sp.]MCI5725785.1 hypothetical protein [Fusobacterium sp.]MCI7222877.1 hypothetical protein [Fusobacterium sp.]